MSFSFVAAGTRDEVVASLDALTSAQLGNDSLGGAIRDAIVDAVSQGTDMIDPSDQRYQVSVFGHSHRGSVVTLNATVNVVKAQPAPDAQTVSTTENSASTESVSTTS